MSKINEQNKTSVPASSAEAKDFLGTINYLAEREKNLSKYSDKLRESLKKIFNTFGEECDCQLCGESEHHEKHHLGHDEQGYITDNVKAYGFKATPAYHVFKAKIDVSMEILDTESFTEGNNPDDEDEYTYYRLWFNGNRLIIAESRTDKDFYVLRGSHPCHRKYATTSRKVLKALVQSGRLPQFLAYAGQNLAEKEQEYKQVAEAAEKMAASLQ
jgi:hypothetical protein